MPPVAAFAWSLFQSTPLMRGATRSAEPFRRARSFNPRPSCEGRHLGVGVKGAIPTVSIHAPHARGDGSASARVREPRGFNPRPSCEGRLNIWLMNAPAAWFQSTPLMRGATRGSAYRRVGLRVSIHAPHARGDAGHVQPVSHMARFQSTPLMRGATQAMSSPSAIWPGFNPRPSCEGRLTTAPRASSPPGFNPRPSCEGRQTRRRARRSGTGFNPRPSCEGRRTATCSAPS